MINNSFYPQSTSEYSRFTLSKEAGLARILFWKKKIQELLSSLTGTLTSRPVLRKNLAVFSFVPFFLISIAPEVYQ